MHVESWPLTHSCLYLLRLQQQPGPAGLQAEAACYWHHVSEARTKDVERPLIIVIHTHFDVSNVATIVYNIKLQINCRNASPAYPAYSKLSVCLSVCRRVCMSNYCVLHVHREPYERASILFGFNSCVSWSSFIIFAPLKQKWILYNNVKFITCLLAWWHRNCDTSNFAKV